MSTLPDGWRRTKVGESARFLTGYPFASPSFAASGIRLIRGSNVKRAMIDWSADIAKYWPRTEPSLRAYELEDGDIVIAMDGALVGRSFARITEQHIPGYLVQRVARLRGTKVDQGLLYAWIGSDAFAQHVDSVKTHTAIPHISPRDIRDFPIDVPVDPTEQRGIAEALADVDRQVDALERLIAKKEAIKQGVMQELLTGEIRLPGFVHKWKPQRLADLLGYEQPGPFLVRTSAQLEQGRVPVLTAGKTFLLGYTNEMDGIYRAHPVIIFDDFTTASQYVDFAFKAKSSAMKILSARSGANLRFLYERMQLIKFPLGDHKRYWISEYSQEVIGVPELKEQEAIADVLQGCADELLYLRLRLTKAKSIKQGMTQELLTGRTRLVLGRRR
jgi:type I restriction enzyme S subunit